MNQPLLKTKNELLQQINQGWLALNEVIKPLTFTQLTTANPHSGWSVKDHLAHLATWENGIVALLQRRPRWQTMQVEQTTEAQGVDALNDIIWQHHKHQTIAEVLTFFQQTHQHLLAILAELTDEDLLKPYSHYQPTEARDNSSEPVLVWIAGNTYEHYAEHQLSIETLLQQLE
jgi:hypothetical protein